MIVQPIPEEVLATAEWHWGSRAPVPKYALKPGNLVFALKVYQPNFHGNNRDQTWKSAQRFAMAQGGEDAVKRLRKCHTEHYWAYYLVPADQL